jgi:hypothetical protein
LALTKLPVSTGGFEAFCKDINGFAFCHGEFDIPLLTPSPIRVSLALTPSLPWRTRRPQGEKLEEIVAYEIDLLPIGDKTSGDSIAVRYGNPQTGYQVILIDGGYSDDSDKVITHITRYYETDRIDHMILSHADNDHACGLIGVLKHSRVGALYMNRPWLYAPQILQHFHGNFTLQGLVADIKSRHEYLIELEKIAAAKGTPVYTLFQGQQIGPITVLAPSEQRYISLLPVLSKTPKSYAAESAPPDIVYGRRRAGRPRGSGPIRAFARAARKPELGAASAPREPAQCDAAGAQLVARPTPSGRERYARSRLLLGRRQRQGAPPQEGRKRVPAPRLPGQDHARGVETSSVQYARSRRVGPFRTEPLLERG